MIVGVNRGVLALFPTQGHIREITDDFIGVHIVTGAGPRLKAIHHELIQELVVEDAFARGNNRIALRFVQPPRLAIGIGRRQFDRDMGLNKIPIRHPPGDGKIVYGAGSLYAIPGVHGNFKLPERVFFNAVWHKLSFLN